MIDSLRRSCAAPLLTALLWALSAPGHAADLRSNADLVRRSTDELGLNQDQRRLLDVYIEAAHPSDRGPVQSLKDAPSRPVPQRIDVLQSNLDISIRNIRQSLTALNAFYASLGPLQRAKWDEDDRRSYVEDPDSSVAPDPEHLNEEPSVASKKNSPPTWLVLPNAGVMARLYPKLMQAEEKPGNARVTCTIDTNGYAYDCKVVSEQPQGSGFGVAAMIATAYMRASPARKAGKPIEAPMTVTFNFKPFQADDGASGASDGDRR